MEPITKEELGGVMADMAHMKSLRIEKFTKFVVTKFYKECWDVMGHDFQLMVIDLIKVGTFPTSVNQGLIILTFKNGEKDNFNN